MSTWANIVKKPTVPHMTTQQVAGTAGSAQAPDYVDKRNLEEEWFTYFQNQRRHTHLGTQRV
jgi:hypothetical protein